MNIITISREFGSGGREVGKRLADALGYGYYDREILTAMAQSTEMEESYLEQILERGAATPQYPGMGVPSTVAIGCWTTCQSKPDSRRASSELGASSTRTPNPCQGA